MGSYYHGPTGYGTDSKLPPVWQAATVLQYATVLAVGYRPDSLRCYFRETAQESDCTGRRQANVPMPLGGILQETHYYEASFSPDTRHHLLSKVGGLLHAKGC